MASKLPIEEHYPFWRLPGEWVEKYGRKGEEIKKYSQPELLKDVETRDRIYMTELYKKKYLKHTEIIPKHIDKFSRTFSKYNDLVHSFTLLGHSGIKKVVIPKAWVLLFSGVNEKNNYWGMKIEDLPKNLVSLSFSLSSSPFDGADFTRFKKLKIITSYNNISKMPKLPPSIEYVTFTGRALGLPGSGVEDFKLSEHPNLKWLYLANSKIPKNRIPQEWKDAIKNKTVEIFLGDETNRIIR